MASATLRSEERIGLGMAIAAHAALVALIVLRPPAAPAIPPPERITVTLSEDAALTSTSPEPRAEPPPDEAPTIGEAPPPPAPMARSVPEPLPQPRIIPNPPPLPRAAPVARPAPRPSPRAVPTPPPLPRARPIAAPARPAARSSAPPLPRGSSRPAGASRVGDDFLRGVPGARSREIPRGQPAAAIGPAERSALSSAISRQLKPHWSVPQGAETEQLVTVLAWSLNRDGSLAGAPRVVRQEGITDANRAQAGRHAEQAIRAVQLAAPFDLPDQFYDGWKRVSSFRFDRRLAQ